MFTGIVSDIGEVVAREDGRFTIRAHYPPQSLEIGGSMACDGCCLTMTSVRRCGGSLFTVDVSNETRAKTAIGDCSRAAHQPRALAAGRRRAWRAPWGT
jgi:riboflavin synthase